MKTWLLLLALVSTAHAEPYSYAPVYTSSGVPGVMVRVGSFRHNAVRGLTVLYCTIESTASVKVLCVLRTARDRLMLLEMHATEHKT